MLYAWMGFLKPDSGPVPQSVQEMTNDFLGQDSVPIQYAGPLRDASGDRVGMMMIFEGGSRDDAESFVNDSPYLRAGLYENHRLYEYSNEVG